MELRIVYEDQLLKVNTKTDFQVSALIDHLRKLLNIECMKVYLIYDNQRLPDNKIISLKEKELYQKDDIVLCAIPDYDEKEKNKLIEKLSWKEQITNDMKPFKNIPYITASAVESIKKSKFYHEKQTGDERIADMIMKVTGAKSKMQVPRQSQERRPPGFSHGPFGRYLIEMGFRPITGNLADFEEMEGIDGEDRERNEIAERDELLRNPFLRQNSSRNAQPQGVNNHSNNRNPFNNNNTQSQPQETGSMQRPNLQQGNPRRHFAVNERIINYDPVLLRSLMEMGFDEEECRIALRLSGNNIEAAAQILINNDQEIYAAYRYLDVDNVLELPVPQSNNFNNSTSSTILSNPFLHPIQPQNSTSQSTQLQPLQQNSNIINTNNNPNVNSNVEMSTMLLNQTQNTSNVSNNPLNIAQLQVPNSDLPTMYQNTQNSLMSNIQSGRNDPGINSVVSRLFPDNPSIIESIPNSENSVTDITEVNIMGPNNIQQNFVVHGAHNLNGKKISI
jgi:hypothetical protein